MTIQQLLQTAKQKLIGITDNPVLEAEILCAYVLRKSRAYLHAKSEQIISDADANLFMQYVARRCQKEPIAYITGAREFWSLSLKVTPDTLIPRPETEILVESVLTQFPDKNAKLKMADLGTGSGAIAIALSSERPLWQIYATDISHHALNVAQENAQQFVLQNIFFKQGNWCDALPSFSKEEAFDVIVSNPPYIAETEWETYADGLNFEPYSALISGQDGLQAIRCIAETAKNFLKPDGYVFIEHGFLQGKKVQTIFADLGYSEIVSLPDLSGHERVTKCRFQ